MIPRITSHDLKALGMGHVAFDIVGGVNLYGALEESELYNLIYRNQGFH